MIRCFVSFLLTASIAVLFATSSATPAQDKKKEKNPLEGKKGTVLGTLVAKGPNYIEVKADGEEKGRKYIPYWRGGAPAQGGGPDKKMLKIFHDLKVGSRLEVQWHFEEHLRVVDVKVLKAPVGDKKEGDKQPDERKTGRTVGTLVSRETNKWIEVKADGEEKARKYLIHAKQPEKLLKSVHHTPVGSRVSVEWVYTNHGPMVHGLEVLVNPSKK